MFFSLFQRKDLKKKFIYFELLKTRLIISIVILFVYKYIYFFNSPMKVCTTVMRLVVRVPVLSEQMAVALPMVSHASRWRTRLLSFIIFCTFDGNQEQRDVQSVDGRMVWRRKTMNKVCTKSTSMIFLSYPHFNCILTYTLQFPFK